MSTYNELKNIIPPDIALANKALQAALQQVKGISNPDLPKLANVVASLETNKGLDLIQDLKEPLPEEVRTTVQSQLGTGTGPNNSVLLTNVVGTAAGVTHNTELPIVTDTLANLQAAGALNSLTFDNGNPYSATPLGVYAVMNYTLAGAYTDSFGPEGEVTGITIPAPQPGAGTYVGNLSVATNSAFASGLIPAAQVKIDLIATANPNARATTNSAFNQMAQQLATETINLTAAGVDFGNLVANSKGSALSVSSSLHEYGKDINEGGAAVFFEAIADTSNLYGQGVIASMREGRNIAVLQAAGLVPDTQVSDANPSVANASLSSAQYTATQADSLIIRN